VTTCPRPNYKNTKGRFPVRYWNRSVFGNSKRTCCWVPHTPFLSSPHTEFGFPPNWFWKSDRNWKIGSKLENRIETGKSDRNWKIGSKLETRIETGKSDRNRKIGSKLENRHGTGNRHWHFNAHNALRPCQRSAQIIMDALYGLISLKQIKCILS